MKHLLALLLCIGLMGGTAAAEEYGLDAASGKDTVYFRSTAKLEFIQGETNSLEGGFEFDIVDPTASVIGLLRVDLRTLKTGIETRDGHMRDNHLHTDDYPYAYFQLTEVAGLPEAIKADSTYRATAGGYFYIRGVKRPLTAEVSLRQVGERLDVRAKFRMKLDDYQIPRPKALFLKLAETVEVEVIFSGHKNLPATPLSLPDWPELD